ncbi:MAG: hypothetical protein WCO81_12650 [Cyanobacteriota bacterium ELA615]|jgi:seryl-tRNA synthetase
MKISQIKKVLAVCCVTLLLFMNVTVKQANADILGDIVTQAGKSFLTSVLNDYNKNSKSAFEGNFNTADKLIKDLSAQLQKASDPKLKVQDRNNILKAIAKSQDNIQKYANSFTELADKTDKYGSEFENSLEKLVSVATKEFNNKLATDKDSFNGIANALSAIAKDTKSVDVNDVGSFFDNIKGNIDNFNKISTTASKLYKAFAS